jgi:hypothetical protein
MRNKIFDMDFAHASEGCMEQRYQQLGPSASWLVVRFVLGQVSDFCSFVFGERELALLVVVNDAAFWDFACSIATSAR